MIVRSRKKALSESPLAVAIEESPTSAIWQGDAYTCFYDLFDSIRELRPALKLEKVLRIRQFFR